LKYIDKLNKEKLDIKSWASDLRLWAKYRPGITPELTFNACVLT